MNVKNKCFSLLLALVLALGMLPVTAVAAEAAPVTVENTTYTKADNTIEVHFGINDTAENNVVVDVMDAVLKCILDENNTDANGAMDMPGDQLKVKVSITNHSPNGFVYKNNGMKLSTHSSYKGETPMSEAVGYDGNQLPLLRIASIEFNHPALQRLFGKPLDAYDWELAATMYDLLKDEGSLDAYFLDYYQEFYKDNTLTWEKLMGSSYREQLHEDFYSRSPGFNGLFSFTPTEDNIKELEKSVLDEYAYGPNDTQLQFKWPEPKLEALSYDLFYQDLLCVVFGDEEVSRQKGSFDHGVGDYRDTSAEPYTGANRYLASMGEIASGKTVSFMLTITLPSERVGNMYNYYKYSDLFDLTLQFVRATTSVSVTKEWNDENDHDGLRPASVSVQLYADGKPSGEPVELNKENGWKHTFDGLTKYSKGKEIVYTVAESAVNGYTSTVSGSAARGFVITNSHELLPPPPQTGDNANVQLWLALACLSLACMAVAFGKARIQSRRKG